MLLLCRLINFLDTKKTSVSPKASVIPMIAIRGTTDAAITTADAGPTPSSSVWLSVCKPLEMTSYKLDILIKPVCLPTESVTCPSTIDPTLYKWFL